MCDEIQPSDSVSQTSAMDSVTSSAKRERLECVKLAERHMLEAQLEQEALEVDLRAQMQQKRAPTLRS